MLFLKMSSLPTYQTASLTWSGRETRSHREACLGAPQHVHSQSKFAQDEQGSTRDLLRHPEHMCRCCRSDHQQAPLWSTTTHEREHVLDNDTGADAGANADEVVPQHLRCDRDTFLSIVALIEQHRGAPLKAYDTLDRGFLLLALQKFGFSDDFVALLGRMHNGTTAQFLMNAELSKQREVIPGILQGCHLAPLLFTITAEILALAIDQEPGIGGILLTGNAKTNKFAAFVDYSAVFVKTGAEVQKLLQVLGTFGEISGLHVQPKKS